MNATNRGDIDQLASQAHQFFLVFHVQLSHEQNIWSSVAVRLFKKN